MPGKRKAPARAEAPGRTANDRLDGTRFGWRAQLFAARFAVSLEMAAAIAVLALGGAHG